MTAVQFCYWLQGYFELGGVGPIPEHHAQSIANHLALVFKHDIDALAGDAQHQAELQQIHDKDQGGKKFRC